jgi:hypothetical protein
MSLLKEEPIMKDLKIASILFLLAALLLVPTSIALATPPAHPWPDGALTPDDEYDEYGSGGWWDGSYGHLYYRYISDQADEWNGFYICNDWWDAPQNFDPVEDCDAKVYNRFDWTDTTPNPDMFWRVNVLSNGNVTVWQQENTEEATWGVIDTTGQGWKSDTGYHVSKNEPNVQHPIWELLIPDEYITSSITVGLIDPKSIDDGDCPDPTDPEEIRSDYGDGGDAGHDPPGCN